MISLLSIVAAEREIWKFVYSYKDFSSPACTAFYYPLLPEYPYWNMVYCDDLDAKVAAEETKVLLDFYKKQNCVGHIYKKTQSDDPSLSVDGFFYLDQSTKMGSVQNFKSQLVKTDDLSLFSKIVAEGFSLEAKVQDDFVSKMKSIQSRMLAKFYLLKIGSEWVGSYSVFETSQGVQYLINGTVLQKFRGQGLANELMAYARQEKGEVVTHSNNPLLRDVVLPKLGFRNVGNLYTYCLKEDEK